MSTSSEKCEPFRLSSCDDAWYLGTSRRSTPLRSTAILFCTLFFAAPACAATRRTRLGPHHAVAILEK
jgi:hypothetical protein